MNRQSPPFASTSLTTGATPFLQAFLTPLSSNIQLEGIFDTALKSYEKKTKQDLKKHDFFKRLEKCDSPGAILAAFQAEVFGSTHTGGDDGLKKWFVPTANVLYAFSATLGQGVGLVFPPAQVVFAGAGVLLLAAKDVAASQDVLVDLFGRIEAFFGRLEIYTGIPLTLAMKGKMVEITVEVLDILATATKEMKQSRTKKFVKRVAGRTDLEDGIKKLDKLTLEEVAMASAQLLSVAHDIQNVVTVVADGVEGVEQKVEVVVGQAEGIKCDIQAISDQVEGVDKKMQVIVDGGKDVMAAVMEEKSTLQRTAKKVEDMQRDKIRDKLVKWQSAPDPSTSHNFASDRQHKGTSQWFMDDNKFGEWKVSGSLLWIHGKPGSGKSVLCSAIINDIITLCKDGSASMAYFYFDFRDVNKQARRHLLPSLLIQLAHRSDHHCDILYRHYKAHDNGTSQLSAGASIQCLKEMLTLPNQGPVYVILDALDECPDTSDVPSAREQVLDLVKDLVSLQLPSLHVCATSRPEADITDALESLASQTVSLQEESGQKKDIADYVRSVVYSGSGKFMKQWRPEDKKHVIKTLSGRADGMFRWVFCQLEMLRNCLPQNVRRVLKDLPKSLDETYERMLNEIGKVNPHQAYRLLQCLTVATRPLRVEELAEFLALDFDRTEHGIPALNQAWRWDDDQQGVLSTCSSLVVIVNNQSSGTRVVQFAHFSVKEFLTSDRLANLEADITRFHIHLEPAHTVIAQACLAILLRSDDNDGADVCSPLHGYAAENWVEHAQFENVSLRVEDGMRRLFDPTKPYFAGWLKSHIIDEKWKYFLPSALLDDHNLKSYYPSLLRKPASSIGDYAPLCLYHAALCGFHVPTQYLISEYPQHVNARIGYNQSALVAALSNQHLQVADLLHQSGADVEITCPGAVTPLHAASASRMIRVVRWLLEHGADGDSQMRDGSTPLLLAIRKGCLELVQTLLQHGVDVNTRDIDEHSPLHYASRLGHVDIVRLLIQHGADANTHVQKLFDLASSSGSVETVRHFIELGADVNEPTGRECKTALHIASSKGHTDVVQLLIEHAADVNSRDRNHRTPLHLASVMGDASTIELLLQRGADFNARAKDNSTPLHRAAFSGSLRAVELLLQHGADINACNAAHMTPLHKLLLNDSELNQPDADVVRLLLKNGANVDVKDDKGRTPIQIASSNGRPYIIQLLSERGACVE